MSNWWILSHGDGDGIASAALSLMHIGNVKGIYITHPAGLKDDLAVVRSGDSAIITDIALSSGITRDLFFELERILKGGGELIYIDHHPLPPGITKQDVPGMFVHDECCSASELTYRFFKKDLNMRSFESRTFEKIALYGAISDYMDNTDWASNALSDWDKRYIYYEAGILSQGLEGMRRQYDLKREIVKAIASGEDPSSISELVVNSIFMSRNEKVLIKFVFENVKTVGRIAYVEEPPGSVPRAATYAMALSGTLIGIAIEKKKDIAVMSVRARDPSLKINEIMMRLAPEFGGNAGGHPTACGARVPLSNLKRFLISLSEAIDS